MGFRRSSISKQFQSAEPFYGKRLAACGSGITMTQARQQFAAEASRVSPQSFHRDDHDNPELVGFRDQITSQVRQSVLVLFAVVLLVLLTACANVAQLLLSRTAERRQELALRAALEASRSRLVQQLTVEATALTLAGSTVGLIVAGADMRVHAIPATALIGVSPLL